MIGSSDRFVLKSAGMAAAPRLATAGWLLPILILLACLPPDPVAAQILPGSKESGVTSALFLPDRAMLRRLVYARELVQQQKYGEAVGLLQVILDLREDSFFNPEATNKSLFLSMKSEAQRLLGELPETGRQVYEAQFGPEARRALTAAVESGDPALLAHVSRRFFHTKAGYEATYRLAAQHFDHGRPLAAASAFDRLRRTPAAAQAFEPMLSLKAALCWERAGMREQAVQTLLELAQRHPDGKITIAGKAVPLAMKPETVMAWLSDLFGSQPATVTPGLNHWSQVRGDPSRNALGSGGAPYLNSGWQASTVEHTAETAEQEAIITRNYEDLLEFYRSNNLDSNFPAIPSMQPLVVDDLVLVRSLGRTQAYELETGRFVWATADTDKYLTRVFENSTNHQVQPPTSTPLSMLTTQRAWRDTTYGTMSSDGQFVYVIEDLSFMSQWSYNPAAPHPLGPTDSNRLAAYEVSTGKLAWELPGRESAEDFQGVFFLGPPLVLGKQLFCLVEVSGEIRLMVFDPQSHQGKLDWSQMLVLAQFNLLQDPGRRARGLSPAYSDGVLVCPTESGAIVAIDLNSRSLLWAHRYTHGVEVNPLSNRMMAAQQQSQARNQHFFGNEQNHWTESMVIIADGKVLITSRDSPDLLCLNLLDGTPAWTSPRGEGLYLGGVLDGKILVVGRTSVQALNLSDGQPAWNESTALPIPSGRGFLSGHHYHLPLITAEVATIDVRDGRVIARSKSRDGRIPGNLIGLRGHIISQNAVSVQSFMQLEMLEAEVQNTLAANPRDPGALALRGEINLQRGQLQEAYADLQKALELNSNDERVREILLGSMLEGLRVDFDTYRKSVDEIEPLITEPQQRSTYLRLLASGLERTGELRAAFDVYLKFVAPDVSVDDLERIDSKVSVRRDRLVRSRLTMLLAAANPTERAEMEQEIRRRFVAVKEKRNFAELQQFLGYFGDDLVRDDVNELLVELMPSGSWLELEALLRDLQQSPRQDVAARATARLAKLLLDADRPQDALLVMQQLSSQYADDVCLDDLTGAQLVTEWEKRPEVMREIARRVAWPVGKVNVDRQPIPGNPNGIRSYSIPISGEPGPFFEHTTLEVNQRGQEFVARDAMGRELWTVSLTNPSNWINPYLNQAFVRDHFAVIAVGARVFAVDTLGLSGEGGARILWQFSLSDTSPNVRQVMLPNGARKFVLTDQAGNLIGSVGPVTRDYVCVQRNRKLMALEPLTGKTLWIRDDVTPGSELFGDEEYLFLVPENGTAAEVFDALNGASLGKRDIAPTAQRVGFHGRHVITWTPVEDQQILARHDVWTGKEQWRLQFAGGSKIELIGGDELAVLEPAGRFVVLNAADGQQRWEARTEPEPNAQSMLVFRSANQYTVIANVPIPQNNELRVAQVGFHSVLVSGRVYGFDRATGKHLFPPTLIDRHAIDVTQTGNLPVLIFTCHFLEQLPNRRGFESQFGVLCLDQRTGKIVYQDKRKDEPLFSVEAVADPESRQLDLKMFRSVLKLTFTDEPVTP